MLNFILNYKKHKTDLKSIENARLMRVNIRNQLFDDGNQLHLKAGGMDLDSPGEQFRRERLAYYDGEIRGLEEAKKVHSL